MRSDFLTIRGKVDPSWIAWVRQHSGQVAREAELLIGVFEQDQTGIGRQAAPIEVESHGFGSDRCQVQRHEVEWGRDSGLHQIDTWDRVCFGARNVHADSLLKL
jgi:hypothetical protein